MIIRSMIATIFIGILSACQTTATAPPWNLPKPEITIAHQNSAMAAHIVQESLPEGKFGKDPTQTNWDYMNGKSRTEPISNMTQANLTSLITGKYHIRSVIDQDHWNVAYYTLNGTTHFCGYRNGRYDEWTLDRYVTKSRFGLNGIFHQDPKKGIASKKYFAWPIIGDSDKGLLYSYYWTGKEWSAERGWIQKEYAAAFAEHCPNLPRVSVVNNNQLGDTFTDLIPEATPIRGFRTAFRNNPEDPLTAGMYYWLYPPE